MEMFELKNGSSEPKVSVISTMVSVEALWKEGIPGMCAVVELHQRCKDPNYQIEESLVEKLEGLALIKNGQIHDTVKHVLLSAITGEYPDLSLGSPLKR